MPDNPPMPQEIKNGFYPDFERGWRRAEVAGRIVMSLAVLGTLLGLLGGGPVSLWTWQVEAGTLRVDYPPVVRFGTPTGLTLHAAARPGETTLTIVMPAALVRTYGLQSVFPHPTRWQADRDGAIHMTFALAEGGGDLRVELGGLPAGSGLMRLSARSDDGQPASWSQVILP